jgi:hypothetical protein
VVVPQTRRKEVVLCGVVREYSSLVSNGHRSIRHCSYSAVGPIRCECRLPCRPSVLYSELFGCAE